MIYEAVSRNSGRTFYGNSIDTDREAHEHSVCMWVCIGFQALSVQLVGSTETYLSEDIMFFRDPDFCNSGHFKTH